METTKNKLVSMLQYMRPAYSITEKLFCEKYLEPVFGPPDVHGNYVKIVCGDNTKWADYPTLAFTAHTDTVHNAEGIQLLDITNDMVTTMTGNCLGADCTTGLWLLLGMIERGVEGVYIAHAAKSFALALDLPNLHADTKGSYTDSQEYAHIVPECTNISVGYYDQHSKMESQDLLFSSMLLEKLCEADWSALDIVRDPTLGNHYDDRLWEPTELDDEEQNEVDALTRLMMDRPRSMGQLLFEYGFTVESICEELNLDYREQCDYQDIYSTNNYF